MNQEIEIWKDIPNYEGMYQVSSFGNVKSLKYGKERFLSTYKNGKGYLQVGLWKNNKLENGRIHILVAMVFKGHIPDGTQNIVVDHDDNDKLNNHKDNIQLLTQRKNLSKDKKNKVSKFTGVSWHKRNNKWIAKIHFKGRDIHLGFYIIEVEASQAYQKALLEVEQGLDLNIIYKRKNNVTSKN